MKYQTKKSLIKFKYKNEKIRFNLILNASIVLITLVLLTLNFVGLDIWKYFKYTIGALSTYTVLLLILLAEVFSIARNSKRFILTRIFNNYLKIPAVIVASYFIAISLVFIITDYKYIFQSQHQLFMYLFCSFTYITVPFLLYHMINTLDVGNEQTIKQLIATRIKLKLIMEASSVKYF